MKNRLAFEVGLLENFKPRNLKKGHATIADFLKDGLTFTAANVTSQIQELHAKYCVRFQWLELRLYQQTIPALLEYLRVMATADYPVSPGTQFPESERAQHLADAARSCNAFIKQLAALEKRHGVKKPRADKLRAQYRAALLKGYKKLGCAHPSTLRRLKRGSKMH